MNLVKEEKVMEFNLSKDNLLFLFLILLESVWGIFYMLYWFVVMGVIIVWMFILFKRLKWVKIVYRGDE